MNGKARIVGRNTQWSTGVGELIVPTIFGRYGDRPYGFGSSRNRSGIYSRPQVVSLQAMKGGD